MEDSNEEKQIWDALYNYQYLNSNYNWNAAVLEFYFIVYVWMLATRVSKLNGNTWFAMLMNILLVFKFSSFSTSFVS